MTFRIINPFNRRIVLKTLSRIFLLAAIALSSGLMTGCRTQKGAATQTAGQTETGEKPLYPVNTSLSSRYVTLTESWKPWNDLEAGVKIKLTSPAKINAAGKAYMKRGEWISISVRMLGFEVATLWIDSDSVVAVDKYHKKYVSEPTSKLLGSAGVTIENIQDMLTGRAFIAGGATASTADISLFDLEQAANGWYILPRRQPVEYTYGFLASNTANGLRGAIVDVKDHGAVSVNYSDIFESRTCGWFAQEVSVENFNKRKISATLQWDLNGAKFNTGLAKKCRIPDNCERIPLASLTSLLKNF